MVSSGSREDGRAEGAAWPDFQTIMVNKDEASALKPIISLVCDAFGISCKNGALSGTLANIDLKRIDPINAMRASLLERLAISQEFCEFTINSQGILEIYEVGGRHSNLDVYYSVASSGYKPQAVNVMVTGGKPPDRRIIHPFTTIIDDDTSTVWDTTALSSNCRAPGFSSSCVITYKDPLMTTGKTSYKDGIDNLFELSSPFQSILGWAWSVTIDNNIVNPMVNIVQQSQASVPICVSKEEDDFFTDIGIPRKRAYISTTGDMSKCVQFERGEGNTGSPLVVNLNDYIKESLLYTSVRNSIINKFMGVNQVYVVAIPLSVCRGLPKPPLINKTNSTENTVVFVSAQTAVNNIYNLRAGEHYIEVYDEDTEENNTTIKLQFAKNTMINDKGTYGTGVFFYVDKYANDLIQVLNAEFNDDNINYVAQGTLLPINSDGQGLLIKQVWLQVDLDTPCFVINDPKGKADEIAKSLKVSISPIVIESLPPFIAMNGVIISQEDGIADNDPTTKQDFSSTAMEQANQNMIGRTLSLNLASLVSEKDVSNLSKSLFEILQEDSGISYTHTCGPTSSPRLGATGPRGYIINTITYNYTDNGSYLITVVEGPLYFGDFIGMGGGIYNKQVEEVSAVGTIIQQYGNHIDYKVAVDGYGTVIAINCYPGVLDIRDRVNVIIHNNAVEA
jgi:hypothetical protein